MKFWLSCNLVETDDALTCCRVDGAMLVIDSYACGRKPNRGISSHTHSNFIGYFKIDPLLNPLRDDPRFKALLKKSGFPE